MMTALAISAFDGKLAEFPTGKDHRLKDDINKGTGFSPLTVYGYIINRRPKFGREHHYGWALERSAPKQ